MNESNILKKKISFSINEFEDQEEIVKFGRALASLDRVKILAVLQTMPRYLSEISRLTNIPISTVSRHMDILTAANFIHVSYKPSPKGHLKLFAKKVLDANIDFETTKVKADANDDFVIEMPIGLFTTCNAVPPCGMAGKAAPLGHFDDPTIFFSPKRTQAELIWFSLGDISYNFPKKEAASYQDISFSFEICSETMYHRMDWPSDITVLINDVEVLTFTSPGDFGGKRGKYSPLYWPIKSTQFGILQNISVNDKGVYLNNSLIDSTISIDNLKLTEFDYIKFTLMIKPDAVHKGGINLFGKNFGNYPQAIIMVLK